MDVIIMIKSLKMVSVFWFSIVAYFHISYGYQQNKNHQNMNRSSLEYVLGTWYQNSKMSTFKV